MITKEYMDALRERYVNAKNNKELESIRMEISRLCDEDAETVANIAVQQIKETREEIQAIAVREKLEQVLPSISLAYIAKTYFNKSRAWLYQRMNGAKVNGKPAEFTQEELKTLNYALNDIGSKLTAIRIS